MSPAHANQVFAPGSVWKPLLPSLCSLSPAQASGHDFSATHVLGSRTVLPPLIPTRTPALAFKITGYQTGCQVGGNLWRRITASPPHTNRDILTLHQRCCPGTKEPTASLEKREMHTEFQPECPEQPSGRCCARLPGGQGPPHPPCSAPSGSLRSQKEAGVPSRVLKSRHEETWVNGQVAK